VPGCGNGCSKGEKPHKRLLPAAVAASSLQEIKMKAAPSK